MPSGGSGAALTHTRFIITTFFIKRVGVRKVIFSSLVGLFLCLQAGCSFYPLRYTVVNTKNLEDRTDVCLMEPNDGPYLIRVTQSNSGRKDFQWTIDGWIEQQKPCRVKYHKLYAANHFMVVEGSVGNGKKMYPILLDTGASQPIFVKDVHVLDNKLPIYPIGTNDIDSEGYRLGLCHLPKLRIGEVTLANLACLYLERHVELELFGLPIAGDESIIVGLPALREFKYVAFDSVNREVEFSHSKVFKPTEPQLWGRYPFSIEEDLYGNALLFVEIPIAGEKMELQLDTGSGNGLAIREELWESMREKIPNVKLKDGRELYPYIGQLPCKRGIIGELKMGDKMVRGAKISVFPDDSPLLIQCHGLLGMQFFQDTVMVLDFEGGLMWIKNPQI